MTGPEPTGTGWAAPDPTPAPPPFAPPTELPPPAPFAPPGPFTPADQVPPPAPFGVPGQFTPAQHGTPPGAVPGAVPGAPPGWAPTYQVPATAMPVQPAAPWRLAGTGVVQLIGAIVAAVGAFLPWVSLSMTMFGDSAYSTTINGFDDGSYGNLVVLFALGLAVLAFAPRTIPGAVPVVIAAMLGLIGVYRLVAIRADANLDLVESFGLGIDIEYGIGLYAVIGGAVLALVGALPRLRRPR
jgi:hypothetical protein